MTHPSLLAAIDREAAEIRDMLDTHPMFAQAMREPSAWRDGAHLVIVDCLAELRLRGPEVVIPRLCAWNRITGGFE